MKADKKDNMKIFSCNACGEFCQVKLFSTHEGDFADIEWGDRVCNLVKCNNGEWQREDVKLSCVKPTFTIDQCDKDGDAYETGIYLNFGHATIRITDTLQGFDTFIEHLQLMRQELCDNLEN